MADLLRGEINPSGKLTETWPLKEEDIPSFGYYADTRKNAQYREGIYVGYRYYEKADVKVRFPFGYGLSYTSFTYSDLKVREHSVKVTVTNSGSRAGAEVVQLYVGAPRDGIYRAKKELKGFEKVFLEKGESREISFTLEDRSFAVYEEGWKVPEGIYEILVGASSADIRLSASIQKKGETILVPSWQKGSWYENPKGHPAKEEWEKLMGRPMPDDTRLIRGSFNMDNTLMELRNFSKIAEIMSSAIEKSIAKGMGIKPDYANVKFRMSALSSVDASVRSMVINSCGKLSYNFAEFIVEMANGHPVRGIKKLINK